MKRKRISILGLFLCLSIALQAQQWTDVTSIFLKSPSFDDNSIDGWTYTYNSQSFNIRLQSAEFFNGTFDIYQMPTLPKGHYRLSVQAYFRISNNQISWNAHQNQTENITAQLYAGNQTKTLKSVYDYSFESYRNNCWSPDGSVYFPNTMESANEAFNDGGYINEIEFDADGQIQLGLRNLSRDYSDNWCMFDNFKLEYLGEFNQVAVSNIEFTAPKTTLQVGEEITLVARALPENATNRELKWVVDNPFVITVGADGRLIARGVGTAHATVQTVDGSNLSRTLTFQVKQAPTTIDTRQWVDITSSYLTNPDFTTNASFEGWDVTRINGTNTVRAGSMEFWNAYMFTAQQQIKGLPSGTYRLSVQGFHRGYDLNPTLSAYCNSQQDRFAYLFADDNRVLMPSYYDLRYQTDEYNDWQHYRIAQDEGYYDDYAFPNTMETVLVAYGDNNYRTSLEFTLNNASNDVNIGVTLDDQIYRSGNWCIFSHFRLEFCGDMVKVNNIQFSDANTELVVNETTQINATVLPANAMIRQLSWSSNNEQVAVVSQEGIVRAIAPGTAVITAMATDGSGVSRSVTVTVKKSGEVTGSLVINEVMAANVDQFVSPAYNFDGWVELYNSSNQTLDLTGLYFSDEAGNLKKWRMPATVGTIPARGYKVVWFDSNNIASQNAPFKLDVDGGTIYLSDADGKLLASQAYPQAMERVSYARTTDGGSTWGQTSMPTPEATNATSRFATEQLAAPAVDQDSRLFDGPFTATVTIPSGATLRYTTDGSLPTLDNGSTSTNGTFRISETTNLRLRLFANDKLASPVTTRSYIYRIRDFMLPVVSVVADDRFIYSTEMGVFAKGPNGRPGNGQSEKCNWNMDWERPVNFSYLSAQGDMVFNQDVDLEMCGGWSRAWDPKAFKLKGNKEMGGNKNLLYPFFSAKPYNRNRTLQIRNGGNDNNCRLRDAALQMIASSAHLNLDYQEFQPVHEFVNGQYMGMLNVREPNNKHFVYANYGWDDDEIDQFEMSPDSGYVQKCGTKDAFLDLVSLSESAANPETYAEICSVLDIDAYANYMALQLYLANWDWPQNNVKGFRHQDHGKFRFVTFDLDGVFSSNDPFNGFMGKENYTFDQLYPVELGRISDQIRFVTLFRNMLANSDFRRRFTDVYCMMGGSVFEAQRSIDIINGITGITNPALALEGRSANNTAKQLKDNLSNRLLTSIRDLCNYQPLDLDFNSRQYVLLSTDVADAQLLINGIQVPTSRFAGYLFAPTTLRAVAPGGYVFQGWKQKASMKETQLFATGATWSYYDQGSLDHADWTSPAYQTTEWKTGGAPLGYNNPNVSETTRLDFGDNANDKRPTYYFRKNVVLNAAPSATTQFRLYCTLDDGAVVYVNGQEAGRYNMPSGLVTYNTFATTYANDNPDRVFFTLDASLFQRGSNVIAVELHNNQANSTDVVWDASFSMLDEDNATPNYYSTKEEITLPEGDVELVASFRPMNTIERMGHSVNPVCINEVSGSNSVYINEYAKKNDWVELYNTTDADIDVEGMFLTDDIDQPMKYQIAKDGTKVNTVIPAHGHLLIWCDKLATTDQALHASFKISGEGGYLMLSDRGRTWTDKFVYSAHDGNTTVGRYPDGASAIYQMNVPTIGKTNMLTSYLVEEPQRDIISGVQPALIASANGFRIRYGAQTLFVKSDEADKAVVDIFTTDGRLIERTAVNITGGTARINVSHLPSGFYVARATNSQDARVSCKFMK
ncbi:CotH kinase family protein [Prevotella sp. E13-17]|uniref:CotH kinase family protein n=1 Tax=Prevotella sp. E13-17 TaxID=2913616 RepID=UPI001EDBB50E|nr:CotH kinase family protein [Prevotella sp. E13-17]UKK50529.1 CotH kinase family protein [Prevotella sp. E13-17]